MATRQQFHRAGFSTDSWDRFEPLLPTIPGGGAVTFTAMTTEPVSAWRAVRIANSNGDVAIAQPVMDVVVLGISLTAANTGAIVTLARTGTYTDLSWNWTAGAPIVLGDDGALTQTLPDDAEVLQPLGLAISATRMLIRIDVQTQLG